VLRERRTVCCLFVNSLWVGQEWDEDLEAIAQEVAERCDPFFNYRHSPAYQKWRQELDQTFEQPNLGQNILVYKKSE